MSIVFVTHPGSHQQFCFAVPDRLVPFIRKGVRVVCDTRRGKQVGTVTTGLLSGAGSRDIAEERGATFPLRDIIGVLVYVDMSEIEIPGYLRGSIPSGEKIARRIEEYRRSGFFDTRIEIVDGKLRDGYTAYLVCKMLDFEQLPCVVTGS